MTPYEILSINSSSDDKTIRNAYLQLVKEHLPDKDPEKFKKIVEAYETVKDENRRLKYYLFNKELPVDYPFEALVLHVKNIEKRIPPGFEQFKELRRDV
jgi:curved DNA-binding protein CbpA